MVPVMSGPLDGALTVAGEPVSLAGGTAITITTGDSGRRDVAMGDRHTTKMSRSSTVGFFRHPRPQIRSAFQGSLACWGRMGHPVRNRCAHYRNE